MSSTEKINEYELLYYVLLSDEVAFELLVEKFERFMWKIIHNVCYDKRNYSFTSEEAFSEAMEAFHDSIYHYRSEMKVPFSGYVITLIKNRVLLLVRKQTAKGFQQLKYALPYDSPLSVQEQVVLSDVIPSERIELDPTIYAQSLEIIENAQLLKKELNKLEQEVFMYRNAGYSYTQIGDKTKLSAKQVDNTLQKIRRVWKSSFDSD